MEWEGDRESEGEGDRQTEREREREREVQHVKTPKKAHGDKQCSHEHTVTFVKSAL